MPESPEAYKNRGNIKVTLKDYENGIQDLNKAKELFEKQGNINAYTAMVEEINKAKSAQSRPQTQASSKSGISGKDVLNTTNTVLDAATQIGGMLMGI